MKLSIPSGTTSKRIGIFIQDSSSTVGAGLSGLAFNTSGLKCYSWIDTDGNAAGTAQTLATATLGTWTTIGFVEKDATNMKGMYEFGIPNALIAAGVKWAILYFYGATNMAPLVAEIEVETDDIAAIKTQTDKLTFTVANKVDSNTLAIAGDTTAATNLKAGALGLVPGTCAAGSTTTSIVTNLSNATDGFYNGRVITFTSGALAGQTTSISNYTGATKTLTVVALTSGPANNDAFVIS